MLKVGFISLGCAKNQVDLERLAGSLSEDSSFVFTVDPSECDLMIINTCGFIRSATEEAIKEILTVRAQIPKSAKLIVCGCMTERYRDKLLAQNAGGKTPLPEIDFAAGVNEPEKIVDYISSLIANHRIEYKKDKRFIFNYPYYAYLKISEGCDNRCSYCVIPSIRGALRSAPENELLAEAERLVSTGVKEIVLVSQDCSKYGQDIKGGRHLPELLEKLAGSLPGTYFRVMYLNPDGVTLKLIKTVKKRRNILRYFDVPVQHFSDKILKKMNRRSDQADIANCFTMIRKELPDAFIRTTIMVGFPGETDEDFEEARRFLEEMKPDYAGFFLYSAEEGTPACYMADQVSKKTANKRLKLLQSAQKKNTMRRLKGMKGSEIICFAEKTNEDFDFILEGRALFQAPEVDGRLFVIEGDAVSGYGPYRAKIKRVAYPDIYVNIVGTV